MQPQEGSPLAAVALRDAPIRKELNVIVVGTRRGKADLIFNPPPDCAPRPGDMLIVVGLRDNLRRLERLAAGGRAG